MIELNFGLFWSGSKLSYLRYLTFKTLRHYHPNSKIQLFIAEKTNKSNYKWVCEKQDFESELEGKDHIEKLNALDVEIVRGDFFGQYQPNFQSDFFRWWWLKNNSGFYLDTDQIILKSFDSLPLDNSLIYSGYAAKSCGYYTPVGCIGADKGSEIVEWIMQLLPQFLNVNNYNSAGPTMFRDMLQMKQWKEKMYNAPPQYFYPIPDSYLAPAIYNGSFKVPEESFALHWFGGLGASQDFNKKYTKILARISNDTISKILRERDLL